jgi:glucosamine--fructose-6-phosphate aminotransferase (isomerizing)
MCGIVGIVGNKAVSHRLIEGLKGIEYRGYDSAGIATIVDGAIDHRRAKGKLIHLEMLTREQPLLGFTGIGHTRWATHGIPSLENTHPHFNHRLAVVHNGIIENHAELRHELQAKGYVFKSDTDTEVVLYLIDTFLECGLSPQDATSQALKRCKGAYALGIIFAENPELLIGARQGSPLALGYGEDEMYIGSDALALMPYTNRVSYLEEGDMVMITRTTANIFDAAGREVTRPIKQNEGLKDTYSKGEFRHFMAKEIFEQPEVVQATLAGYLNEDHNGLKPLDLPFDLAKLPKITIVACGTAFYAGMVAKYWIESVARVPVDIEIASEFRYRQPPLPQGGLAIFISQSGETADTLAAHAYAKDNGQYTLAVVNVKESSLARLAHVALHTQAGTEIGVASTKAFTSQLAVLACLTLSVAQARNAIDSQEVARLSRVLSYVPEDLREVLKLEEHIKEIAQEIVHAQDVLYLGRGPSYPLALEGALKLKEISYIHAEGYAAGEMKHGPIALIDSSVPVIIIAPSDQFFEKTASNLQEVIARGGKVILLSDAKGLKQVAELPFKPLCLAEVDPFVIPLVYTIPIQLLAYHTAAFKGTDVDQPRNLAKSVTVE